jgi:hypothetical protein
MRPVTRSRPALVALAAFLALAATLAGVPAAASVADSPVEYSTDGATWSPVAPAALFPPGTTLAPGTTRSATLFVRATRPGETIVGVFAGNASASDPALLSAAAVSRAGGAAVALDAGCTEVAPQAVLATGQVLEIPLTVGLDAGLTSGAGGSLGFDLLLDLSEPGPVVLSNGCPVDPTIVAAFADRPASGATARVELPATGGLVPLEGLVLGAALFAGGAVAVAVGLRRGRVRER